MQTHFLHNFSWNPASTRASLFTNLEVKYLTFISFDSSPKYFLTFCFKTKNFLTLFLNVIKFYRIVNVGKNL